MTDKVFLTRLHEIVQPGTRNALNYTSESDYPVEIVDAGGRLFPRDAMEPNRFVIQANAQSDTPDGPRWQLLQSLFPLTKWYEARRYDDEQGVRLYYFCVWLNSRWIGIRCRSVET